MTIIAKPSGTAAANHACGMRSAGDSASKRTIVMSVCIDQ